MGCEVEVAKACAWFGEQLFEPNEQRQIFIDRLRDLLIKRYEGHWYPEEPHRGCAFRAILSTVNQLDPLLLRAAESTGQRGLFESFNRVFSDCGEVNCWINPGEVKVIRGRAQQVLYSDGKGSDNPYEKLRVKIEPTRLAVKVDPVEYVPSSPVSSHNGSQSGMGGDGGGFSTFVRGATSHGGSSHDCSQSQSPTESPMQSWSRNGNGGLPAMAPLPPHIGNGGNGAFGGGVFGQGFGGESGGFAPGGFSQGLDGSSAMGGSFGGLAGMGGGGMGGGNGMGGGFGGSNSLLQQQQQQPPPPQNQQPPVSSAGPHGASPMRPGYFGGGSNSFGSTPVF